MSIITGADIAVHLGIDDTEDNQVLDWAAAATNEKINAYCDREFVTTATTDASARTFYGYGYEVELDDFWETSVLVVKYDATNSGTYTQTLTLNVDFFLEPLNGRLNGRAWPYTTIKLFGTVWSNSPYGPLQPYYRPNFEVTAAWGWASIPDAVQFAARVEGAALYHRKNSPSGVVGGFADFTPLRVSRFEDPDVEGLLLPYRKSDTGLYVG